MTSVQRAFNWASKAGLLKSVGSKSPLASLEKPQQGRRELLVCEEEYREVLGLVVDEEFRDLLELSWKTGCRPHELFTVEATFVDLDTGRWVFPSRLSKGKKLQRVVYLFERALEITRRLVLKRPSGPLLLNTDGRPWCVSSVKCRFQIIQRNLGRRRLRQLALVPPKIPRLKAHERKDSATRSEHERPELTESDPRWFGTSVLPFAYDPEATCGQFIQFLRQVLERQPETGLALQQGDRRLEVLQEWIGYTLLCDGRFQKFLLMVGDGSNGKGVIQNLWIKMLGQDNVSHVSLDQLGGGFTLQPLLGKLANICGDLGEIDAVAEGILKRLTGQDNVIVDRKYQSPITMAPSVKLIFAANTLPRFMDKSLGIWRRLMAMPFRVIIPDDQQDETLTTKLEAELPGILNWALQGLRRLLQQGYFTHCEVCAEAAGQHRFDCDPAAQFVEECVWFQAPDSDAVHRIAKDKLYQQYRERCKRNGYTPLNKNKFNRRIKNLGVVKSERQTTADPDGRRPETWVRIGKPVPMPPSGR